MKPLTRDTVVLPVVTLVVVCAVGTLFLASAKRRPASDLEMCATPTSDAGAETPFLAENIAAMKKNDG